MKLSLQLTRLALSRHDSRESESRGSFPHTNFSYQQAADPSSAVTSPTRPGSLFRAAQLRSFRLLSKQAAETESSWSFAVEMAVFGLVTAIAAWSLITLLSVLAQTAGG